MNFRKAFILSTAVFCASLLILAPQTPAQNDRVAENRGLSPTAAPSPAAETDYSSVSTMSRAGVQTAQSVPLTLQEAIRMALENNNNIEMSRSDVRSQETNITALRGFYDPIFTASPLYSRSQTTGSAATNDLNVNTDVRGFIKPGGGSYSTFFNNSRTENAFSQAQLTSGSLSSAGAAAYSSQLGFRYTQPLLRNFAIDSQRRNIKVAKRQLEQTETDFQRQTVEIVTQVQRTYWDLVFALRDQQNRVANLNLSQENLRQVEARIAAGAAAPLARAEVATELANRESELLLATQQVSITENSLKQLLLRDALSPLWTQAFVPTDTPAFSLDAVNMDAAINDAMENRYELRRLKLAREINQIDIKYLKNQTRPQLDLNTQFSVNGFSRGNVDTGSFFMPVISGDPATNASAFLLQTIRNLHPTATINPPSILVAGSPGYFNGGFNRSLANMFRSDAPNYSVGVTFSFPLRNRTAKANLANARINEERLQSETRASEQTVLVEVRNAVQAVETTRQRVLTARRARENAEIQLEGERKLFDSGRSTTFLLFQRENALTAARNAEIRAETDYNKALAELQRATSTTLQENNITLADPLDDK